MAAGPGKASACPAPVFINDTILGLTPDRRPSADSFVQEYSIGATLLSAASLSSSPASPLKDEPARVPVPSTPEARKDGGVRKLSLSLHLDASPSEKLPRPGHGQFGQASGLWPPPPMPYDAQGAHLLAPRGLPLTMGHPGLLSEEEEEEDDDEYEDEDEEEDPSPSGLPGAVHVLRLADAIGEPQLGSPEFPTRGSAGHQAGACKPCAFLGKGCTSGVDCRFCHLCSPDEKKRRKKEKLLIRRQVSRWHKKANAQQGAADSASSPASWCSPMGSSPLRTLPMPVGFSFPA
mmetsp:Transcript_102081/g.263932  ORF Transcript_102081/g.263932 Transcript_102081/m.263932 type:complete len:291 (-) Transcript_102081:171-1043(-)